MDIKTFDPTSPVFNADPYAAYAAFRREAPVAHIGPPYDAHWVFSRELVKQVCDPKNKTVFLKPGKNRAGEGRRPFSISAQFGDGLFYMDPDRHTEVREMMDGVFAAATANAEAVAAAIADKLAAEAAKEGRLEVIGGYAGPLAAQVFFQIMGVPPGDKKGTERVVVDSWIRSALRSHDKTASPLAGMAGGTAAMAMRTYFLALGREAAAADKAAADEKIASTTATSIIAGMRRLTGTPPGQLSEDESTNTAVNMALGGYLSTEFLIGTGVYNLLRHPEQWQLLRSGAVTLDQAISEMLRFDAPFQMADRWVERDTKLGGVTLPGGKMFTVVYGSANRDLPAEQQPDRFDIQRKQDDRDHFGFGEGIHYCIGAPLARKVTKAALQALLTHGPHARIGEVGTWSADPYFRSLAKLGLLLR